MQKQLNQTLKFVGGKALFDPNFIPTKIVPQKKYSKLIRGIINDGLEDKYSTNLIVYGIPGTGKNLQINYFLQDIMSNNTNGPTSCYLARINCENKSINEIFFTIIDEISKNTNLSKNYDLAEKINKDVIYNKNNASLWNLFHLLVNRLDLPLILYFQNIEHLDKKLLNKLFSYAKDTNKLYVITAMNTDARMQYFRDLTDIDQTIKFSNTYELSDLSEIVKDRCLMAFENEVNDTIQDLIIDYSCEFGSKVPGSCVGILKHIYPTIYNQGDISAEELRLQNQYYFDNYSIDAFSLSDFMKDSSFEENLFLEYIVGHFSAHDNAYISFLELKDAFQMSSEELGIKTNWDEFNQSLLRFFNYNILLPSRKAITKQKISKVDGIYKVPYFMPIPEDELNEILSFNFGMLG